MKKAISLLLALVLCLSLCACKAEVSPVTTVDPEVQAFEDADALLQAGEYEAAIQVFSAIGNYQQIAEKIATAERLWEEEKNGFLFGTWKDLNSVGSFAFNNDYLCKFSAGDYSESFQYSIRDGVVSLFTDVVVTVQEIDGITHLISDTYDLVKEENYKALAPEAIEITLENWDTYFEARPATSHAYTVLGELETPFFGFGIFLREEYLDRFTDMPLEIGFKAKLSGYFHPLIGENLASGVFEIGDPVEPFTENIETRYVQSFLHFSDERSDFSGTVAANFTTPVAWGEWDKNDYTSLIYDTIQVEMVEGILYLKQQ